MQSVIWLKSQIFDAPPLYYFSLCLKHLYVIDSRRIRSHVAKKSFLYPSNRYTIFRPVLIICAGSNISVFKNLRNSIFNTSLPHALSGINNPNQAFRFHANAVFMFLITRSLDYNVKWTVKTVLGNWKSAIAKLLCNFLCKGDMDFDKQLELARKEMPALFEK